MTAKELASALNGREYGGEIYPEEQREAEASRLVVAFGYSDDNVELKGAVDEEIGAYEGATLHFTKDGLLQEPACESSELCDCPYFQKAKRSARTVKAVWHDEGGPCWTFETTIPHETFEIMEDGEVFCIGIVFSLQDIGQQVKEEPAK